MRTPDGRECPYFYAGYHRQVTAKAVCNLLDGKPDAQRWSPDFCATCPVPDIRRANACRNMVLDARVGKSGWRFWEKERMLVRATCTRTGTTVADPYVGCGQCHGSLTFVVGKDPEA